LSNKILYIVDIKYKQKENFNLSGYIKEGSSVLSLTPYSSYFLDKLKIDYKTFHDILSIEDFRDNLIKEYKKIEKIFDTYQDFSYMFYYLVLIKTKQIYYKSIEDFISIEKKINQKIIYITDSKRVNPDMKNYNFISNNYTLLHTFKDIDTIIELSNRDNYFYFRKKIDYLLSQLINIKQLSTKIKKYILKKKYKVTLSYDNINFDSFFRAKKDKQVNIPLEDIKREYQIVKENLYPILQVESSSKYINNMYKNFFSSIEDGLNSTSKIQNIKIEPFIFISNHYDMIKGLIYKYNKIPKIFMQHGSYLHENITLKYCEIYPADINFVFNDYVKEFFIKRGSKRVEVIGSINFNKPIKVKRAKYDYVYITFCSNYTYSGTFIGEREAIVSMDAMNIYQRHKYIIELFGTKFISKKLCIKIQHNIMLSHLYIPLIELSRNYNNITIDFTTPLHSLIEWSKYILSDYFSTEFTNIDLHYKKDIILFQNAPYPLKKDILEDMKKMFILVDTIDDLEDKIKNIEKITKNRKRDSHIIEKYASKRCDTESIAINILKKYLDGR